MKIYAYTLLPMRRSRITPLPQYKKHSDWSHCHFLEEIAENWGDFSLKHFVGFQKQRNTQTLGFLFGAEGITVSIVIDMYLPKSSISPWILVNVYFDVLASLICLRQFEILSSFTYPGICTNDFLLISDRNDSYLFHFS